MSGRVDFFKRVSIRVQLAEVCSATAMRSLGPRTPARWAAADQRLLTSSPTIPSVHEHQLVGQQQHLRILLPITERCVLEARRAGKIVFGVPFLSLTRAGPSVCGRKSYGRCPGEGIVLHSFVTIGNEINRVAP